MAEQQGRRLSVCSSELKPSCGGKACPADFGYDDSQCPIAQAIFHDREHVLVAPGLDEHHLVRPKPRLLETGRIEVEPGRYPQSRSSLGRKAGRNARREERRGRIFGEARRRGSDFVERGSVQAAIGEPIVENLDAERQNLRRACARFDCCKIGAQTREQV